MAISDWPMKERPRGKLLHQGASALSDAELLAIFLRTGAPGMTAVDLARQLLNKFGGLRPLLSAETKQFCDGHGLGLAKYAQLQAVLEMSRRHLQESLARGEGLTSPKLTRQYLLTCLRDQQQEQFGCLFLDSQHRVIAFETLFYGTIDAACVYPREVVRRCLTRQAAAVILAPTIKPSEAWKWGSAYTPVLMQTRPVIRQMTMVSMNGPIMATIPSRAASVVFAAAWAKAAEPRPASLEKAARLMPVTRTPRKPPNAAGPVKASPTILAIMSGMSPMCDMMMRREKAT